MLTSDWQVFGALEADWEAFLRAPVTRRAMAAWPAEGGLATAARVLHDPSLRVAMSDMRADRVLLALAERAPSDDVAGRVLLQLLLPGVRRLAGALWWLDAEDAAPAALGAVWEQIRRYPAGRRPAKVAANILLDARQCLVRSRRPDACYRRSPVRMGCGADELDLCVNAAGGAVSGLSESEELLVLLSEAVRNRRLSAVEASVISRSRIRDVPWTDEPGTTQTALKRRWRAERRLAEAV